MLVINILMKSPKKAYLCPFGSLVLVTLGTLQKQESFQRVGQSISDSQMEQLQNQLDTFRANLETFARLHRKDIQKDPIFRMHFQKMCGNIGVDPLACKVELFAFV